MDILFVRNLFRPADFGGNRYPWEVTRRLAERHRLRVVTPRPSGSLPGRTGAQLHHYPVSRRTPLETFVTNALFSRLTVERQIAKTRPDIIVMSSYDVGYGYQMAPRVDIPTVYIYHSSFYSPAVDRVADKPIPLRWAHRPLRGFLIHVEKTVLDRSSAIVAVSPFSRREIEARIGEVGSRVSVIPTGVDGNLFSPGDRLEARARLGIHPTAKVLVTAGRLAPVKRYDRAIDTLALLRREDPSYELIIVGDGPDRPRLEAHAAASDAEGHIRFAGYKDGDDLVSLYRAADVALCTSDFENWSLAILEALATGTPVIGTPRGSIPDLLGLVDPWLVAADAEPEALSAKVSKLLTQPERRDKLAKLARERVSGSYSWENTVHQLETVFEKLLKRG